MASQQPPTTAATIDVVREATARLEATVQQAIEDRGPVAFSAPSRLPDWSIGHVVTHLARNADGLRRVLLAAQEGRQITPYASPEARVNDIEQGALRDTATIAADFRSANAQLAQTMSALPPEVWQSTIDLGRGGPAPADVVLSARLCEVELHHHDLGVDDGLALLDDAQANRLLTALMKSYVRTRAVSGLTLSPNGSENISIAGGGQQIAGPALDIAGWLSGRSNGATLRTAGPLPALPTW